MDPPGRGLPLPGKPERFIPKGLDLQAIVPGRLAMWAMTTTGQWVGWINYETPTMRGVTGWVPAAALEPHHDQPARRDYPATY